MGANFFAALLLLLLLASVSMLSDFSHGSKLGPPRTGAWSPITNVSDPHVGEIGSYAVTEHNREANANLVLIKVIKGEEQVVGGVNYKLVLEAKDDDGGKVGNYEAVVLERAWEKSLKLTSFKPVET